MPVTVQQMAGRVAELLESRLKLRGATLAEKLARGGRHLPRKVRREAEVLANAAEAERVPRLQMQLDHVRITRAYDVCVRYLKPLGAETRRRALFFEMLTGFGTGIFVTIVLILVVLIWRGLV